MKKPIILQGALSSEIDLLLDKVDILKIVDIGNCVFYEGTYFDYPIVISKTKIGEISATMSTTVAIMQYEPLLIINQGTAGAMDYELNQGDIVIGDKVCYISYFAMEEDRDNSAINPWKSDGYKSIDGEVISMEADSVLLSWLKAYSDSKGVKIRFDTIGSGDVWTRSKEEMEKHHKNYGIVCEAMECTGVYMTANSFGIPAVSIRVIANNERKGQDYDESYGKVAQRLTLDIVQEYIKSMDK